MQHTKRIAGIKHFSVRNSSSSSSIGHGLVPHADPFRSCTSRSLFSGLPWFLVPFGL